MPEVIMVALLRCWRLQAAGHTERDSAMAMLRQDTINEGPANRVNQSNQAGRRRRTGERVLCRRRAPHRHHLQRISSPNHFFEMEA